VGVIRIRLYQLKGAVGSVERLGTTQEHAHLLKRRLLSLMQLLSIYSQVAMLKKLIVVKMGGQCQGISDRSVMLTAR
jgi:hypothetical protein